MYTAVLVIVIMGTQGVHRVDHIDHKDLVSCKKAEQRFHAETRTFNKKVDFNGDRQAVTYCESK